MVRESRLQVLISTAHELTDMNLEETETVAHLAALRRAYIMIARAQACPGAGVLAEKLHELAALPEELPTRIQGRELNVRRVELPLGLLIDVVG